MLLDEFEAVRVFEVICSDGEIFISASLMIKTPSHYKHVRWFEDGSISITVANLVPPREPRFEKHATVEQFCSSYNLD